MEQSLIEAQKAVTRRDKMVKLVNGKLFDEIIQDGYFRDEAARLATALTNPSMQDDIDQRNLIEMTKAIGHIQNWILNVTREGNTAEMQIEEWKKEEIEKSKIIDVEMEVDPITGDEFEVK